MPDSPLVSIVITSHTVERLDDIIKLVDSIRDQSYPAIETILIVERSEPLFEGIKKYLDNVKYKDARVIFSQDKLGLSGGRNLGIKNSSADIIAFADDDVVLFPNWAEEMVKTYDSEDVIGVTGPGLPLWQEESMNWLPEEFYWIISCTAFTGWTDPRPVRSAWGMNMSFRREAFDYCTFSDNFGHTSGEKEAWKAGPVDDAEYSINLRLKSGKQIMYNPQVKVKHRVYTYRLSRKFIRGQCYWQGYTKALLKRLYKGDEDTQSLVRERDLLRRILFGLLPKTIGQLFTKPRLAWRKLDLTVRVLFYVALGYSAAAFPRLAGFTARYFR